MVLQWDVPLDPLWQIASYHEKIWLNECPIEFRPVYYQRYVDDIFVLFKSTEHIEKFHSYLNSRHEKINFSVEVE